MGRGRKGEKKDAGVKDEENGEREKLYISFGSTFPSFSRAEKFTNAGANNRKPQKFNYEYYK